MPEFDGFGGILFELQIRTVLQHAWAEIEHAHYKNKESLPLAVKRRLYLAAGLLEVADRELAQVTEEIERYSEEVGARIGRGDLDAPVDAVSLARLAKERIPYFRNIIENIHVGEQFLKEMHNFKILTLGDAQGLLSKDFLQVYPIDPDDNVFGLFRSAMLYNDLDRFLKDSYKGG